MSSGSQREKLHMKSQQTEIPYLGLYMGGARLLAAVISCEPDRSCGLGRSKGRGPNGFDESGPFEADLAVRSFFRGQKITHPAKFKWLSRSLDPDTFMYTELDGNSDP